MDVRYGEAELKKSPSRNGPARFDQSNVVRTMAKDLPSSVGKGAQRDLAVSS